MSHGILAGNLAVTAVLLLGVIGTSQYSLSVCLSVTLSVATYITHSHVYIQLTKLLSRYVRDIVNLRYCLLCFQ